MTTLEVLVWEHNNIFSHFHELIASSFPLKDFVLKLGEMNSITIPNLELLFQSTTQTRQNWNDPILNIFVLNVSNFEVYRNMTRSRIINFIENVNINESLIVYFPNIYRVDERIYVSYQKCLFLYRNPIYNYLIRSIWIQFK